MDYKQLLTVEQFCTLYGVEVSFINSLSEYGLLETSNLNDVEYIHTEQISSIEKMMRLYYELDINVAGIEVIFRLLEKIETMQAELALLKSNSIKFQSSFNNH